MSTKAQQAIGDVIAGMQALTLGVQLTTALVGIIRASRPELVTVTDAEIIAQYRAASMREHQAVLADQQRLDRETQVAAIVPAQQTT